MNDDKTVNSNDLNNFKHIASEQPKQTIVEKAEYEKLKELNKKLALFNKNDYSETSK